MRDDALRGAAVILRVYDPPECDEHGPLDWECCRTCAPSIDVPLTPGPYNGLKPSAERDPNCRVCDGHGSLKAAALAGLEALRRDRWSIFSPGPDFDPAVRCKDCGHPMSNGTWDGPASKFIGPGEHQVPPEQVFGEWLEQQRGEPTGRYNADFYSPCDEGCRHGGYALVRDGGSSYMDATSTAADHAAQRGDEPDTPLLASWRSVDVRALGWPHDLRPEKLAVLCLRCYAERIRG